MDRHAVYPSLPSPPQEVGEAGQSAARQEAIDFQAQVYAECKLPKLGFVPLSSRPQAEACVNQQYQRQRNVWAARLSPALQEEANRPPALHLQLQAALQKLGYIPPTSKIDGVYGPTTRAAVTSWQITNKFPPTGILSTPESQLLLQETGSARTPPVSAPSATSTGAIPASKTAVPAIANKTPAPPVIDEQAARAAEERRLEISKAEAERAKAEAVKAQADAERARAEAAVLAAKERAEEEARQKADEQARAEQTARGIQP